ncbi:serine/threonine-protein kinase PknK [Chondromyces crocatus]|uniref:Protein kinase domain-containing protein n=1 Tax=Chondromyces crocatus TaxID=52 RepID=A0A0K1EGJ4_CHOCO|nr:serine/threonine-protein kinase [Chondromyces crocatus]AKT39991.1 uncharacterized protein CMC5_041440 [Chondromyces crocatus]
MMLGSYRVVGVLARGGMGLVYRGEHERSGEAVALKTVRSVVGDQLASIRREIQALRRVRHPGIVRILDDGVSEGLPWVAMPLLQGRTLRQHLASLWVEPSGEARGARGARGIAADSAGTAALATALLGDAAGRASDHAEDSAPGAVTPGMPDASREAAGTRPVARGAVLAGMLSLLRRLCEPLAFLHGEGLVHRDLKPENVFLQEDGRPVLVDLGIAAHVGDAGGREVLEVALLQGTPQYMAPEQLRGELVDARADLYALGCILYECATGQPPFTGESFASVRHQHLHERPLPPSLRVPGLPVALDQLVLQLLEKRPEDRPGYAMDVAAALSALGADAGPEAGRPDAGPTPRAYLYRPGLLGRAEAMTTLEEAIGAMARRERGGMVLVRGESGVGKTRLLREMTRIAVQRSGSHQEITVLAGRCAALGTSEGSVRGEGSSGPLHAFRSVLMEVADRARAGGHEVSEHLLGPRGKILSVYEPALLGLPGQQEQPTPAALPPEAARARVIASLEETITALSASSPLLLVLDDLQWSDELSLSLVEALSRESEARRGVLVVATYRAEETRPELEALSALPGVRSIALSRLDAPSVKAMVSDMLALRTPPRGVLEALVGHSSGNPFFVAEYLRAAIGEGMLRRDAAGRWQFEAGSPGSALSSLPLPDTLAALVERRLRRLEDGGRALLAWAAVLGQELETELLLAGASSEAEAEEAIEALRVRQVLEAGPGGRLRFVHDKIREIAYERLGEAARLELHRKAGALLEARHGEARDMASTLAHHFLRGRVHGKAGRYFARAAERAREVYANGEAIRFYQAGIEAVREEAARGGEFGEGEMPDLAALHERLGDVLGLVGRQGDARGAYEAALAVGPEPPHLHPARLLRKLGESLELHHDHDAALSRYAEAEAALGERPAGRAAAWWDEWLLVQMNCIAIHYWRADVERVRALVETIRPVVEENATAMQRAHFLSVLVKMNLQRERYATSAETVQLSRACFAAFEQAEGTPEGLLSLRARFSLGFNLMMNDAHLEAEEQFSAVLHIAERTGDIEMQTRCLSYLAIVQRRLGRLLLAETLAERSLATARAAGMNEYAGAALGTLAWVALRRGHHDEAAMRAQEALAHWAPSSHVYPFEWVARLPLLAHLLRVEAGDEDILVHLKAILDTRQQRLPDAIADALSQAEEAGHRGSNEQARTALARAIEAAAEQGFA